MCSSDLAAGVSPALVQHHYGTKEALRRACDEYVIQVIRETKEEALAGGMSDSGFLAIAMRTALPVQRYVARVLTDRSPAARTLFDDAVAYSEDLLARGLPAAALQLEITERILMNEAAYASDTVSALAELGIPLSLDDFGTGYSSLVRLYRLPVEEIKIDSSFIGRLAESPEDALIVRSIVDLVRTLGLRSVAEGVEDPVTAGMLREMGCDAAQGWHFGRPMDAETATDWLRRHLQRAPEPAA